MTFHRAVWQVEERGVGELHQTNDDEKHLMLKLKFHHVPEKGVRTRVRIVRRREKA